MTGASAVGRLPNLLVIGAAKSGTSSLWKYLSAHPDVHMYSGKEIDYFSAYPDKGLPWYLGHFREASDALVVGEASPSYLTDPETPRRVAQVIPEARLVVILRHPIDRAHSLYWFRREIREESRAFAEAIHREMAGEVVPGCEYLTHGRYALDLGRWSEFFPRESLYVSLLDDLRAQPQQEFASLCRFLDIADDVPLREVGRVYNRTFNPRLWPLVRLMIRIDSWRGSRLLWAPIVLAQTRLQQPYPPMDGSIRGELVEWFKPHNERLAEWLGRELPESWSR